MSAEVTRLEGLGTPIRRPSALGGSARRFFHLTWTLAVLEFKLKFFGSVLGYLWQLMRPLMLFGVLYIVFTQVASFGQGIPFYGVSLLVGIVIFTFYQEATGGSVTSVVDRENLVRKIHFPRMVIPLAAVLTSCFNLGLNLLVVVVFMVATGVTITFAWLLVIPILAMLAVLCVGLAMFLSAKYVRYRDVRPIWEVVLQILFYATPILYPISKVVDKNETIAKIMMCNPLAFAIQQVRHEMIGSSVQSPAAVLGNDLLVLIPVALVVIVFAVGFWVFDHDAPHIAEEL